MIESDLPFTKGTAQRFMAISRDERLSNTAHGPLLPVSWRTLYELTKLDDVTLEAKFLDGTIRPEMHSPHDG